MVVITKPVIGGTAVDAVEHLVRIAELRREGRLALVDQRPRNRRASFWKICGSALGLLAT